MIHEEDRDIHQMSTHSVVVLGLDRFMTRLGPPQGGKSYAGWACEPKHADRVMAWVKALGDIKFVRFASRFPEGRGHCHVYVVNEGHPALEST